MVIMPIKLADIFSHTLGNHNCGRSNLFSAREFQPHPVLIILFEPMTKIISMNRFSTPCVRLLLKDTKSNRNAIIAEFYCP